MHGRGLGEEAEVAKYLTDLLSERRAREGSIQHVVGPSDFLCQWHLAADASDRFSAGEAVSFLEARNLGVAVGGDHDGCVDAFVYAGLEQERHFIDDHSMGFAFGDPTHESLLLACDMGVDDSFKLAQFGPVSENKGSQLTTIEGAVRIEDGLAERVYDLAPGRLAWPHDIVGQLVGIDDRCAALFEHLGDGSFAGGDAACETDQNHGCGA